MSNPTSSTAAKALVDSATVFIEETKPASPAPDDSMFSTPSSLTDVVLVVEGKKLHVSKALLCLTSPAFLKMFEGDFKNKTEVPIADKKYADFVEFLLCVHPSTCKPVQRKTLDIVLPLADEYEVESLVQRCEQFVLTMFLLKDDEQSNPANEELVHFSYLAEKYKLTSLLDKCLEKLKYRTYDGNRGVRKFPEFQRLSSDTKLRVMSERLILMERPVVNMLGVHIPVPFKNSPYPNVAKSIYKYGSPSPKNAESLLSELAKSIDQLKRMFVHNFK
ncbi:BTB and MATH domain-containing protein 38-like [Haliotis rubra]|uniref:BTB and MATH domain-containing protein 38-like n=1 Tax=Haliotis rubra TaxID=36100 RepID=UPI001EE5ABBA|nr:BTB and MATH domain-containing protein 38-like [Haliotis rubra]